MKKRLLAQEMLEPRETLPKCPKRDCPEVISLGR